MIFFIKLEISNRKTFLYIQISSLYYIILFYNYVIIFAFRSFQKYNEIKFRKQQAVFDDIRPGLCTYNANKLILILFTILY